MGVGSEWVVRGGSAHLMGTRQWSVVMRESGLDWGLGEWW